ncbi:MAG: aminoglycoside phosphotransferase family protein, partial [Actinomycetota bacterium]
MSDLDGFRQRLSAQMGEDAAAWLATLDGFVQTLEARWELELGDPYPRSQVGWTVRAIRHGEEPCVLRIAYPDGWFLEETEALRRWNGEGAVRLLADDANGAQRVERCEPGTALDVAAGVAERLWAADGTGIATVAEETLEWARTMPGRHALMGRPFERSLVDEAVALIRDLAASQPERVLLHGDLTVEHILASDREPWLAIGPKPLAGERAFDVTSLIRDRREALVASADGGRAQLQRRFDRLSERLDLDTQRLKSWTVAVSVDDALWAYEA